MENPKETKLTPEVQRFLEEEIKRRISVKIPHICSYCDWMQFNKTVKPGVPRNRYCQYDGNIKLEKGVCQMWVIASDLDKRVRGNYTV